MIVKDRDSQNDDPRDVYSRAGAEAERQMAFYLRREFGDQPDILILNDIRLTVEDTTRETCQIDHLVIHRHGLILVESKSVSGRIGINRLGEWTRTWSGSEQGMASPVKQVKLQALLLHKALCSVSEALLGKMFGSFQKRFTHCPLDVLVAISDRGIIEPRAIDVPELCKADQIPDRVRAIATRHKKAAGPFSLNLSDGIMKFSDDEIQAIATFILDHHSPIAKKKKAVSPRTVATVPTPICTPRQCPRCRKILVRRKAKRGANTGEEFWGCSGFPACRYIEK